MTHLARTLVLPLAFTFLLPACGGGGGGADPAPEPDPAQTVPQEIVLATAEFSGGGGGSLPGTEIPTALRLAVGPERTTPTASTSLVTPGDVGRTFEFPAGLTTGIDRWFFELTDGIDSELAATIEVHPIGRVSASSSDESHRLENKDARLGGPDLEGAEITRVVLEITRLELASTTTDYDFAYGIRLTFHGHASGIPLPRMPLPPGGPVLGQ